MSRTALDWSVLTMSERAELLRQRERLRNQTMAERVESLFSDGELEAIENGWRGTDDPWSGRDPERVPIADRAAYADYLRSYHWLKMRQYSLLRAGFRCQQCERDDGRLDVHHRSYDRLGKEHEDDLVVLCGDCHAVEHRGQS
jgi:5-methylcytosine-specific restriction endonuclease McrA